MRRWHRSANGERCICSASKRARKPQRRKPARKRSRNCAALRSATFGGLNACLKFGCFWFVGVIVVCCRFHDDERPSDALHADDRACNVKTTPCRGDPYRFIAVLGSELPLNAHHLTVPHRTCHVADSKTLRDLCLAGRWSRWTRTGTQMLDLFGNTSNQRGQLGGTTGHQIAVNKVPAILTRWDALIMSVAGHEIN